MTEFAFWDGRRQACRDDEKWDETPLLSDFDTKEERLSVYFRTLLPATLPHEIPPSLAQTQHACHQGQ
jgi:hypothetical protein